MKPEALAQYQAVQNIALRVLRDIRPFIRAGVTEQQIADKAAALLAEQGVTQTWYHDVPALVLVGEHSVVSVSGKQYTPTSLQVQTLDLVTIDVSPQLRGYWGDCARSYVVADGRVVGEDEAAHIPGTAELIEGIAAEKRLHGLLLRVAEPEMSMHDLHEVVNTEIRRMGYENLDFLGNLGHSIERKLADRRFIEPGRDTKLGECTCFTFEPHLRRVGGSWGFKRENIYYFEGRELQTLGSEELLKLL